LGSATGRDEFIIAEALAKAFVALEQLPPVPEPTRNIADIKTYVIDGNGWGSLP
jgi:hypothetical protein